eukprot:3046160-Rhodomonas_salina.1
MVNLASTLWVYNSCRRCRSAAQGTNLRPRREPSPHRVRDDPASCDEEGAGTWSGRFVESPRALHKLRCCTS